MDLVVARSGPHWRARFGDLEWRCAVGRTGVSADKREGDGATPVGRWPMRRLLYRADRLVPPVTVLDAGPIAPDDAWCDDPGHQAYNRAVRLPFAAGRERLWRDDGLYDLVVVLGHNDDPPAPGRGSCIFLHVARADYGATEGCVALARGDLVELLRRVTAHSGVAVRSPDVAQSSAG